MTERDAEKLKKAMKERDEDNGGEPLNAVDRGYHLACEHLNEEIDKLLKEQKSCEDAISRELAIKGLTGFYEPLKEEDVITVLKGLPSVTPKLSECEDVVSRKAVADIINEQSFRMEKLAWDIIKRNLEALPSVTPAQKTKAEIIDDLIKEIKDAEKKFDDKGAHHVSAGFCYARKELERMKGV